MLPTVQGCWTWDGEGQAPVMLRWKQRRVTLWTQAQPRAKIPLIIPAVLPTASAHQATLQVSPCQGSQEVSKTLIASAKCPLHNQMRAPVLCQTPNLYQAFRSCPCGSYIARMPSWSPSTSCHLALFTLIPHTASKRSSSPTRRGRAVVRQGRVQGVSQQLASTSST